MSRVKADKVHLVSNIAIAAASNLYIVGGLSATADRFKDASQPWQVELEKTCRNAVGRRHGEASASISQRWGFPSSGIGLQTCRCSVTRTGRYGGYYDLLSFYFFPLTRRNCNR